MNGLARKRTRPLRYSILAFAHDYRATVRLHATPSELNFKRKKQRRNVTSNPLLLKFLKGLFTSAMRGRRMLMQRLLRKCTYVDEEYWASQPNRSAHPVRSYGASVILTNLNF